MTKLNKVSVTYHAPKDDSKVVEMLNTTFYDGIAVDVICTQPMQDQLENNPHFQVNSVTENEAANEAEEETEPESEAAHEHGRGFRR